MSTTQLSYIAWPGAGPDVNTLSLVAPQHTLRRLDDFREWCDMTGLTGEQCVLSPYLAEPVPLLNPTLTSGPKILAAFPTITAQALRHPIFWAAPLSAPLSGTPFVIPDDVEANPMLWAVQSDTVFDRRTETAAEMATRLLLEVAGSGMFDPTTGSWVDILAMFGLPQSDASDARIVAWLHGAADPILDSVRLPVGAESISWGLAHGAAVEMAFEAAQNGLYADAEGNRVDIFPTVDGMTVGNAKFQRVSAALSGADPQFRDAVVIPALSAQLAYRTRWSGTVRSLSAGMAVRSWALNAEAILSVGDEVSNLIEEGLTQPDSVLFELLEELCSSTLIGLVALAPSSSAAHLPTVDWSGLKDRLDGLASAVSVGLVAGADGVIEAFEILSEEAFPQLELVIGWCVDYLTGDED